jgi:hypothetical protein
MDTTDKTAEADVKQIAVTVLEGTISDEDIEAFGGRCCRFCHQSYSMANDGSEDMGFCHDCAAEKIVELARFIASPPAALPVVGEGGDVLADALNLLGCCAGPKEIKSVVRIVRKSVLGLPGTEEVIDKLAARVVADAAKLADLRKGQVIRPDHGGTVSVWRWQGDGSDRPETLVCDVLMTALQAQEYEVMQQEHAVKMAELEAVWARCKVIYHPPNGEYPVEHNPHARKDAREIIKRYLEAAALASTDSQPRSTHEDAAGGETLNEKA